MTFEVALLWQLFDQTSLTQHTPWQQADIDACTKLYYVPPMCSFDVELCQLQRCWPPSCI